MIKVTMPTKILRLLYFPKRCHARGVDPFAVAVVTVQSLATCYLEYEHVNLLLFLSTSGVFCHSQC